MMKRTQSSETDHLGLERVPPEKECFTIPSIRCIHVYPEGFIDAVIQAMSTVKEGTYMGLKKAPKAMIKDILNLDQNGSPVDATKYHSMIGALMYLASSRSDIVHAIYADYAGCKDTFKSTSGGAQFLGEKLVSWSSKKQDCTALSTAEVEYVSLSEHVEKGTIELYFVKTDYQLADLFTKALPVDRFNYLVRRLGMRSLSPRELDRLAKSQ
ncbi:hypothetical protein Tco_0084097 [Tanacetum coccineum]